MGSPLSHWSGFSLGPLLMAIKGEMLDAIPRSLSWPQKIISRAQTLKVVRPAVFPPEQSNNNQACARRLAFECAADVRGRGAKRR
jgi:hypothetical protein